MLQHRNGREAAVCEIGTPSHLLFPPVAVALEDHSVRVLLVEDHKPLVRALRQGLEEEGFAVDIAQDGEEADHKANTVEYDVVILDLMLPKIDGITLLNRWRKKGLKTHVLVLTARDTLENKVSGLDA